MNQIMSIKNPSWRLVLLFVLYVSSTSSALSYIHVPCWSVFELKYSAGFKGNPFTDVKLSAEFRQGEKVFMVDGFYDGDQTFRIRFMPDAEGEWFYKTASSVKKMDGKSGTFLCVAAQAVSHGPVAVLDTFNFGFADGKPFYPVGTTCYQWVFQGDPEMTLTSLAKSSFNKIRMCVFPKNYDVYINNEPSLYPFEGSGEAGWDFDRFNPAYFRLFEDKIKRLDSIGIQADIILFHPYDWGKWGFDKMPQAKREQYLQYLVARISSFENVWWSLANEFEYLGISKDDWEKLFILLKDKDPYHHLTSIHNGEHWYDVSKSYITHLSVQTTDFFDIQDWRDKFKKPVIIDECVYEGDIPADWGNLTAEEMTSRFWQVYCRGGYCTHGETYLDPQNVLWWSKGGILHGQSPVRIAFLRKIMEERPGSGVHPFHNTWNKEMYLIKDNVYYLYYYGNTQQKKARFFLLDNVKFRIELIDTWNMTIEPLKGEYSGKVDIPMPGKPWMAVRITRL